MEKINVAELLKDCPKGMELDCTMYDNLFFDSLNADYYGTINCYTLIDGIKTSINFTKYGTFNNHIGAKCVIFPKGKTTWEGFMPYCNFKDGDVVACNCSDDNSQLFIFKEYDDNGGTVCYLFLDTDGSLDIDEFAWEIDRLATDEEKAKLFQAIKDNGYRWNDETKTLEKLIESKEDTEDKTVMAGIYFNREYYADEVELHLGNYEIEVRDGKTYAVFKNQDDWELAPDKFDITTLKPFDKVLVRMDNKHVWSIQFFERLNNILKDPFVCMGRERYHQCIPYDGNEHLLNTAKDCEDYFKTWE